MKRIIFKAVPYDKNLVTLALESGVDAVMVESEHVKGVQDLGRVEVITPKQMPAQPVNEKKDEETAVQRIQKGENIVLQQGWEIIPVENILAQVDSLAVEAESLDTAILAAGVLERGADTIVVLPEAAADLKRIVKELKLSQGTMELETAVVTEVAPAGLGHRVCVDTTSMLNKGQGMLVGNSSAFTFLVHAETESNPYVAARPFRINAGAVHAYCAMPGDKTSYLEELSSGTEVLIVGHDGASSLATVGRCKVEVRPMLLIKAEIKTKDGVREGQVFLQNAETIRVVTPEGEPVSVVKVKPGDKLLVRTDQAGRHFGMRITEEIKEG
ncbi:3-dehydroquinate synthase II family protein [Pseudodesulfovibrio senegalensis]|jgi:3-dehydroquinate synthase II|uniref:3-dehydroquinate synthase II family protein n=1 Tax=Pseudodesulfovibrio senegalensis TaxID=1721087 RepID=A0A6N6N0D8_9BACT|nr:3-dehydroquinate synthase II family protein [Pseudodesulfovibrio senegalensis]KAB1438798.1 3-dehydroquinate synthase II family protein [Pseudodesulfovibrio senegalensis]